jgi:uncharacterized protein YjdB
MKHTHKCIGIAVMTAIVLTIAGCAKPSVESVIISADGGTTSVKAGETLRFSAAVTGKNNPSQAVTWSVSSTSDGAGPVAAGTEISPSGSLAVAAKETAATLYVRAVSTENTGKFDYMQVNVSAAPSAAAAPAAAKAPATVTEVAVSPENPTLGRGDTETFTAKVTGTNSPGQGVTWKVSSTEDGKGIVSSTGTSIDAKGVLTVGANEKVGPIYVIATSTVDAKKTGSAKVTAEANRRPGQGGGNRPGGQGGSGQGGGNRPGGQGGSGGQSGGGQSGGGQSGGGQSGGGQGDGGQSAETGE